MNKKGKSLKGFFIGIGIAFAIVLIAVWVLFCVLGHKGLVSIPVVDQFLSVFGMEYKPESLAVADTEEKEKKTDTETQVEDTEDIEPVDVDDYKVEPADAEEYFKGKAQIMQTIDVEKSQSLQSESDIYTFFGDRGWSDLVIVSDYNIKGTYTDSEVIDNYSSTLHPEYDTMYISDQTGVCWYITVTNGVIMAQPLSFYDENNFEYRVIIAETDSLMGYDSNEDKFYQIVPEESYAKTIKVDRVDKETLDSLTSKEFNR